MDMDAMVRALKETEAKIFMNLGIFANQAVQVSKLRSEAERVRRVDKAKLKFLKLDPDALSDLADVAIEVQDGGQLPAHSLILSSRSDVFKLQFEKYGKVVKIEDASLAVMDVFLKFCYTAEIEFTDEASALEVLKVAHSYKIDHLQDLCAEELLKTMNKHTAEEILKLSQTDKLRKLQEAASHYMTQNSAVVAAAV